MLTNTLDTQVSFNPTSGYLDGHRTLLIRWYGITCRIIGTTGVYDIFSISILLFCSFSFSWSLSCFSNFSCPCIICMSSSDCCWFVIATTTRRSRTKKHVLGCGLLRQSPDLDIWTRMVSRSSYTIFSKVLWGIY